MGGIQMKSILFPDAKDRTVNDPSVLINKQDILRLYNQAHMENQEKTHITEDVKKWIGTESQKYQWWRCDFIADQCILTAKVSIITSALD